MFVFFQFVAHPHCQQLLASIWYEGLPGWRKHTFAAKMFIVVSLIFLMPVMGVYYLILPRSKLGQILRTPFMKFMYHSASFGVFLFLLILASTNVSSGGHDAKSRQQQRGPPPTLLEWLIVFYVMGKLTPPHTSIEYPIVFYVMGKLCPTSYIYRISHCILCHG